MKLLSLQLCNFRQFYGKTPKIKFGNQERNVTVLFGVNGAGKTTLLNAFTWALYKQFSKGFQIPEALINKRALWEANVGDTVECWVELTFEHGDKVYMAKRIHRVKKEDDHRAHRLTEGDLELSFANLDGKWQLASGTGTLGPEDMIGQVLPETLHGYFFFDGERIERIVNAAEEERKKIGEATQLLLGIEAWTRAERHLDEARKDLEKEYEQVADVNTQTAIEQKHKLEAMRDEKKTRVKDLKKQIDEHGQRREAIDQRLLEVREISNLQQERQRLQERRQLVIEQYQVESKRLLEKFSRQGYWAVLREPVEKFRQLVEDRRQKGELPTGIKTQFVQDLLVSGQCICGSELCAGSPERIKVEGWLSRGGSADEEQRILRLSGELADYEQKVSQYGEETTHIKTRRAALLQERSQIENALEKISDQLTMAPVELVQELEKRRREIGERMTQDAKDMGSLETQIDASEEQIKQLTREIERGQQKEGQQRVALRRVCVAKDARDRIMEARKRLDQNMRLDLQSRVQELFKQMTFKPYWPVLTESYALKLMEKTGSAVKEVPASQGEMQLLSLSFIGSVIAHAKAWSAKSPAFISSDSSTYPLVMDSPFGSLDSTYRQAIAQRIDSLADQAVLMVSQTQWNGEVERALSNKLGRCYRFIYHTPKDVEHKDPLILQGRAYPLVQRSVSEYEFTEIEEIVHGQ